MSGTIAIIDYGMGNLRSVQKGFEQVGVSAEIVTEPRILEASNGVVLPGVGAFGDAMAQLNETGLDEAIVNYIDSGRPFLGICLGFQLLFDESDEDGPHQGLGIFRGRVERLPESVKIPHMGWNQILPQQKIDLLADVPSGAHFYFVHSYVVRPAEKGIVATTTDYGLTFVSGVARGRVFAFQFHPEKSGSTGLAVLKRFGWLCNSAS